MPMFFGYRIGSYLCVKAERRVGPLVARKQLFDDL